ncbi:MAG: hypothetical protein HS111_06865 [Kofleriaceae bacterium]|nr:hypothetical protein [Kofleriaceae bacterium]MCL4225585.1 hypothetical protein [Myxococcales bacterium]
MAKHNHRLPKHRRRNADGIPDDVLLPLAPVQPSFLQPQATQPALPYPYPYSPPPLRTTRATPKRPWSSVKKKAAEAAAALKPEAATITKEHLFGVGANAAGGVATALAANELVDNVGVMPMAIGATVIGGLGSAFLKGNWQKVAQGVLGAGVGQLGTAYLTERALKKAAAAQKEVERIQPAPSVKPSSDGKRNAYLGGSDDDTMHRAMDRYERRIDAILADDEPRNAYGDAGIDGDAWAGGYDGASYGYAA